QPVLPHALAAAPPRRALHRLRSCRRRLGGTRPARAGRSHPRHRSAVIMSFRRTVPRVQVLRRVVLSFALAIGGALALVALTAPAAHAQLGSFGTNKIQYRDFD